MRWPSSAVRETFINYFVKHGSLPHLHVPSASIIPKKEDKSLAFVNAGMNQFKDIILGLGRPPSDRVTNSQKCLRINDLSLVGVDTYHHTFFEMLGNWSFANYFKAEACQLAWDLLTNTYKLDKDRFYVTYFAGAEGIPMDEETKRIWEKIGIPKDRILPFTSDNFWAMGPLGPCGPSTELHYDHRGPAQNPQDVNKDSGNVVEVWNLVFMQYNRMEGGALERLPLSHVVDTGAGLERLTAVLNGKICNYQTDLFTPIFDCVHKISKVPAYSGKFGPDAELDKSYRLFADHIRAITVALADGVLPQSNHKIRKLIQRSLTVSEKNFLHTDPDLLSIFLNESASSVASTLSKVYPETEGMKDEIKEILNLEVERYIEGTRNNKGNNRDLQDLGVPPLLLMDFPALGRIKKSALQRVKGSGTLGGQEAFKWYESLGISSEASEELCASLGIKFSKDDLHNEMERVKKGFRDEVAKEQLLLNTERNFTRKVESALKGFNPEEAGGICKPYMTEKEDGEVTIEWIFNEDGDLLQEVSARDEKEVYVILNQTLFIPGGPCLKGDEGIMVLEDGTWPLGISDIKVTPSGFILHKIVNIPDSGLKPKMKIRYFITENDRVFGRELSAQTLRQLQHWLFQTFKIIRFTDGFISDDEVKLEFTLLKGEIGLKDINKVEQELDEKYGTPLVIVKRTLRKNNEYEVVGATGLGAEIARRNGSDALKVLEDLEKLDVTLEEHCEDIKSTCQELRRCLQDEGVKFPYFVEKLIQEGVDKAEKALLKKGEALEVQKFTEELKKECLGGPSYVVRCFKSENEFSSLKKITRVVENERPVLILIASEDGFVQGRCSIPEKISNSNESLSALEWMSSLTSEIFGAGNPQVSVHPPKGQNPKLVANLKRIRIPNNNNDENVGLKIESGLKVAEKYIMDKIKFDEDKTDRKKIIN